jgi:hypothetical protein
MSVRGTISEPKPPDNRSRFDRFCDFMYRYEDAIGCLVVLPVCVIILPLGILLCLGSLAGLGEGPRGSPPPDRDRR